MNTKTIAVASRKGGVAKSTSAIGLAELFARTVGPTAVVDIDQQGDSSLWHSEAEALGDPLACDVIRPPAEITAVKLAGWIREHQTLPPRLLFDCPGGIADLQDAAVEIAVERRGFVLVPTSPDPIDVKGAGQMLRALDRRAPAFVLLTTVERNTILQKEAREDLIVLCDEYGGELLDTEVEKRQEIKREILNPLHETSLLLNAYAPVLAELEERT